MHHECEVGADAGALSTVDASRGDELIGWDTDQFPASLYLTTQVILTVWKMGGFTTGGLDFDAKVRRESFEPIDLFFAHIGGMDAFARGLKILAAIRADGRLAELVKNRYASWESGIGSSIEAGKEGFASLEEYTLSRPDPVQHGSGRQEIFRKHRQRADLT
jgi:xylose isomerase